MKITSCSQLSVFDQKATMNVSRRLCSSSSRSRARWTWVLRCQNAIVSACGPPPPSQLNCSSLSLSLSLSLSHMEMELLHFWSQSATWKRAFPCLLLAPKDFSSSDCVLSSCSLQDNVVNEIDILWCQLLRRNWYALIPIVACIIRNIILIMIQIVGRYGIPTDDLKHALRSIILSTQDEY